MFDGWLVSARLAQYLGLMAGFGLALFTWQALLREHADAVITRRLLRLAGVASMLAVLASVFGLWAMAHAMGGGDASDTWTTAWILLTQTTAGMAWIVRVVLLALAVCLAASSRLRVGIRVAGMTVLAAGALSTLAWAGHGAMSEGEGAWLHLVADIAHLLVAGAWFGALVALVLVARQASGEADAASVRLLADVSRGFARLGSMIVIVLFASGVANYIFVVGPDVSGIFANTYGRLLLAKLGVFAGMLALAAANRFRFAPALARALQEGDAASAVSTLRRSLRVETTLAVVVLVLVALLGTLDPTG